MCAENAQDSQDTLREKIADLKKFVNRSNQIEQRIQSTLNNVQQIRDEVENLLSSLRSLQAGGIQSILNGEEIPDPERRPHPPEPDSPRTGDGAQETTEEPDQQTPPPPEDPDSDEEQINEPLKAGEFPGEDELNWEPEASTTTEDGTQEPDDISTAENTTSS